MKKTVRVRYFAILREQRGLDEERIATEAATAGELYEELRRRHPVLASGRQASGRDQRRVRAMGLPRCSDGDALVFIPPVAGG